jgi:hypothetical protein
LPDFSPEEGLTLSAKHKLNGAHLDFALLLAGVAGLACQSWTVFFVVFVVLTVIALIAGDIRM